MGDERPVQIDRGRPESEKGNAKYSVAMLSKGKKVYVGACGKNVEEDMSTWRRNSIVVDSGARDNVTSPDDVLVQTVFESVGSKKGVKSLLALASQSSISETSRSNPLASAKGICQAGHSVVSVERGVCSSSASPPSRSIG